MYTLVFAHHHTVSSSTTSCLSRTAEGRWNAVTCRRLVADWHSNMQKYQAMQKEVKTTWNFVKERWHRFIKKISSSGDSILTYLPLKTLSFLKSRPLWFPKGVLWAIILPSLLLCHTSLPSIHHLSLQSVLTIWHFNLRQTIIHNHHTSHVIAFLSKSTFLW